jgi:hypothetical protein
MPKARFPLFLPDRIAVHHSASGRGTTFAQVERWHTAPKRADGKGGKGWPAIGYNHVIGAKCPGRPGRIVPQRGAAVALRNSGTISVLVMGHNSPEIARGRPLWRVPHERRRWLQPEVDDLVRYLEACFMIWPHLEDQVGGHRDFTAPGRPSECPGLDIGKLRGCRWNLELYWRRALERARG